MFVVLVMVSALLGESPVDRTAQDEQDSYKAALEQIGPGADAHVRLALWCEAHGLNSERTKHLSLAVLKAPAHPLARALLGMVAYRGRWERPEAVSAAVAADPARKALMAEYEAKRDKLAETADAHWRLALWSEEKGLKAESVAQLWSTVHLDRNREAAWRRLGYKKQKDGRWLTEAQSAREKEEADLQKRANLHWKPILEKWRSSLAKNDPAHRAGAEKELSELTDPRAVPMVWAVFATGDEACQRLAVQAFGQIDAVAASRALAMLAVFSQSAEVRRNATETLARRDVREFGNVLISLLCTPIKYEVRHVKGPGSRGELFIQGKKANLQRRYSPPTAPNVSVGPGGRVVYDASGLPVIVYDEGIVQTGRIPVPALLSNGPYLQDAGFLGPTAGSLAPAFQGPTAGSLAPARLSPAQAHGVQNAIARSGVGAAGSAALGEFFLANPAAANMLSWSNYPVSGPGLTPSPYAAMQQIATGMVEAGYVTSRNGLGFTLGEEFVVPIGRMMVEAEKSAMSAEQQLQNDVASIERFNEPLVRRNQRIVPILKAVSGQDLGTDHEPWEKWWVDQIGYTIMPQKFSNSATTVIEDVPLSYQPQPVPVGEFFGVLEVHRMSCFGAGTLVHTLTGTRPIEVLKVGEEVLTQDIENGALAYQPILAVHHNPPSKTLRITLGDETIVSSEFHRFWKAGQGWVMARDLKSADRVRTLRGMAKVKSIEAGSVQPVFNLDVTEDADFFAGALGALVHDNTLPDLRIAPFDAPPSLTASSHP